MDTFYVECRDFNHLDSGPGILGCWLRSTTAYPTLESALAAIRMGAHPGVAVRVVDDTGNPVAKPLDGPSAGLLDTTDP